jgi:hypothetical protein
VREVIGALSVIPAKRGRPMREPGDIGASWLSPSRGGSIACATWQVTVISVMKRKLGDLAPGHTVHMQCKQALPSGLTYNLHLLKYALSWRFPPLRLFPPGLRGSWLALASSQYLHCIQCAQRLEPRYT